MKRLLILTAVIEGPTGLALIAVPSFVVHLLLGAEIAGASIPLARVAGAALLALSVACWLARKDLRSSAATGTVGGMLLYNIGTVAVLVATGSGSQMVGIALWPAVILHTVMAIWCFGSLRRTIKE